MGCGGIILFFVALGIFNALNSPSVPAALPTDAAATAVVPDTPPPDTPFVDRHAQRQVAQDYWSRVISKAALVDTTVDLAGQSIAELDRTSAIQLFRVSEQQAFGAAIASGENVPEGWDDVHEHMSNAMNGYSAAYKDMADALDSDQPSDYATARSEGRASRREYYEAIHLARVHYVAMGGKWQDVSDGSSEAKSMKELIDAMNPGTDHAR